jgi:hypothetical protein
MDVRRERKVISLCRSNEPINKGTKLMNNPMAVDVMLQIAAAHRYEMYQNAEQRRLASIALADRPHRSVVERLVNVFRHEQPVVEVVVTVAETLEAAAAPVDPYKTQPLKAIRRTEELRRTFYEHIRQGNALQEMEEQGERQWQVGGA